ncbi:MAG: MBL fold metallo-hydrolase RNA specificity domain-containing protein, partial [Candidatus Sumerlaeota bacterium]
NAIAALDQFKSVSYGQYFSVSPDIEACFNDAGHILGSSSVEMNFEEGGSRKRMVFSGDIGRVGLPLLRDPMIPEKVNWLVMEGTYGARTHDPVSEACEELRAVVERAVARGGKILIPSFSVERTQEILYYLNQLTNDGKLPRIPVFLDSPLAVNVTEIFRQHKECYDEETVKIMETDPDPIGFDRLKMIRNVEESKALNYFRGSCIIISASGMCEAGRILHHLRNNIENPKTIIVFVGYQAEGTLGRKIVERRPRVNIFGEPRDLKAEVATLNTMSGHADKDELFRYAKTVRDNSPHLEKIVLVHGEESGLETFAERLRSELQVEVSVPELEQEVLLQ